METLNKKYDVVIIGAGVAGLFCALNLPADKNILILCKGDFSESDSYLAQGGICVQRDDNDFEGFYADTMKAGHFENNETAVKEMIKNSREVISDLISLGVDFTKDENGNLCYTREGGHSEYRILYHEDVTGKEITSTLLQRAQERKNITFSVQSEVIDIIVRSGECAGVIVRKNDKVFPVYADGVLLATGGVGGLYENSTNFSILTGDAVAIALKHGVKTQNLDYVQIHPTTFYSENGGRCFLISESVRGEGAIILDENGERFVNELLPRDVVSAAIHKKMKEQGTKHVWLDMRPVGEKTIYEHFPTIAKRCKEKGYDVTKQPIPIVPAQHYFMGGIKVDLNGATNMHRLYAAGETACNGVHGKNRLASNSLLESIVWAKKAALAMKNLSPVSYDDIKINLAQYDDYESLKKRYASAVKKRINKEYKMIDDIAMRIHGDDLIKAALKEDVTNEDVSTACILKECVIGEADLIAKQNGVIAGLGVFGRVFAILSDSVSVEYFKADGDRVEKGEVLAKVRGDMRVILTGERTALNYLQRMSGIATYTAELCKILEGTGIKLVDTRKTTPNMRYFEKYAVRVGGGGNHRYNLSDAILLKDNHIGAAGGVKQAVKMAKEYASFVMKVEVETENLQMVKDAVEAGADIIMLDNMTDSEMKKAVEYINGRAIVECSGNVTKENIARLADIGIDIVSSGALTHSSPILDVSLKNLHPIN